MYAEENANKFQHMVNNDIDLNEFPMPENMSLSESMLKIIRIFTEIYFPII